MEHSAAAVRHCAWTEGKHIRRNGENSERRRRDFAAEQSGGTATVAGSAKVATIQHNVAVVLPVFGQEPLMTSQQGDCILNKKQPFTENRSLEEKGVGS